MGREFGIVVFGASGFTGKRVLVEVAASAAKIKWAAAGRSQDKIASTLRDVGLLDVDIITADCGDSASLEAMCKRADVVINCTGPFRFYGEPVVKACVANGTHYVDITGEPEFIENMELVYSEEAKKNGSHVVQCCGFDSVPADEGFLFTQELFGRCLQAESFLSLKFSPEKGGAVHATTFECIVHGVGSVKELKRIREELKKIRPRGVDPVGPKLKIKDLYSDEREGGFVAKFPGADASVVRRSELYRSAKSKEPQVQYSAYITIGNWWNAVRLGFHQTLITSTISFDWGKKIVLQHPGLFTAGAFTHEGPTEEQMASTSFEMTFYALGYSRNQENRYSGSPNLKVKTRVSGPEPGYIATPIFAVAAALTILEERHNMCAPGVHTPSLAFAGTRYRERLINRGIKFEILEQTPLSPEDSRNTRKP